MKQKIDPKDIRKGDLIRAEYQDRFYDEEDLPRKVAVEYVAGTEEDPHRLLVLATYYLLDRPVPPFEPKDGMRIQRHDDSYYTGVRIGGDWLAKDNIESDMHWFSDDWAKRKLAGDWVVIEKPASGD